MTNQITEQFLDRADALEAIADSDRILAWGNGLAVYLVDGQARATNIESASVIMTDAQSRTMPEDAWGYIPIVRNGHGEEARLMTRTDAAKREAANLRRLAAL